MYISPSKIIFYLNIYLKILFIILLITLYKSAASAEIGFTTDISKTLSSPRCSDNMVYIGEILLGDFNKVKNSIDYYKDALKKANCNYQHLTMFLESVGGSVDEAIKIGDLIRKEKIRIQVVDKCYSACVFILAAGVDRRAGAHTVGLHRPYFELIKTKNEQEVREAREKVINQIRNYLVRVDVSLMLLDSMLAIPPNEIKTLSSEDLVLYRLVGEDPTFEEMEVSKQAQYYGITSAEYRKLVIKSKNQCQVIDITCKDAILFQLSPKEYELRFAKAQSLCSNIRNNEGYKSCFTKYMTGKK